MKFKVIAALVASLGALAVAPAHAGALAAANINITGLALVDAITGAPIAPGSITVVSESRTGTAAASYNGVSAEAVGAVGPSSITSFSIGGNVDVQNRCVSSAGACGAGVSALYGGTLENNGTAKLAPVPTENFALGDMALTGTAVGGTVNGLTRADALAAGPTNGGGSNATILNSAGLQASFAVGQTFTGRVTALVDAYIRAWVQSNSPTELNTANSGYGFTLSITSSSDTSFIPLVFTPEELNKTFLSLVEGDNVVYSYFGAVQSDARTFLGGKIYNLSINQSSNATVNSRDIPEPASIALAGLALLGAGVASRRRRAAAKA